MVQKIALVPFHKLQNGAGQCFSNVRKILSGKEKCILDKCKRPNGITAGKNVKRAKKMEEKYTASEREREKNNQSPIVFRKLIYSVAEQIDFYLYRISWRCQALGMRAHAHTRSVLLSIWGVCLFRLHCS